MNTGQAVTCKRKRTWWIWSWWLLSLPMEYSWVVKEKGIIFIFSLSPRDCLKCPETDKSSLIWWWGILPILMGAQGYKSCKYGCWKLIQIILIPKPKQLLLCHFSSASSSQFQELTQHLLSLSFPKMYCVNTKETRKRPAESRWNTDHWARPIFPQSLVSILWI